MTKTATASSQSHVILDVSLVFFITELSDLSEVLQTFGEKLSKEETEVFSNIDHENDEDDVKELIGEADLDGDGNVNYEEFIAMIFKV